MNRVVGKGVPSEAFRLGVKGVCADISEYLLATVNTLRRHEMAAHDRPLSGTLLQGSKKRTTLRFCRPVQHPLVSSEQSVISRC
jgi:hypothetical protein